MSKVLKSAPNQLWTTYSYVLSRVNNVALYMVLWTDKIHCFITPRIKLLDNQICVYLSHVSAQTYIIWLFQRVHTSFLAEGIGCYIFIAGNQLWTGDFVT